jgi:23S rRNA (cytosine1962-C5)-methyltransferase
MVIVQLRSGKEGKILNGYPWVFRDELKSIQGDTGESGEANVFSSDYGFLGRGYYNPYSNRAVMVLTNGDEKLGKELFKKRIIRALEKRERLYLEPFYRLVHGEGDRLPGLVVDRYGDVLVVQFRNRVVQEFKDVFVDVFKEVLSPTGIFERSDFEMGVDDQIERNTGILYGSIPEEMEVLENGLRFRADVRRGQKTGFFFDQRESRSFCRSITAKLSLKRGLDLFSFSGAFALNMAISGAEVICVDKSAEDLELARTNFEMNGLDNRVQLVQNDVFDYLGGFEMKDQFDIVVLDPPSLVKHRREIPNGISFFKRLVTGSLPIIRDGGVLGICTCAYNISIDHLVEVVRRSTERSGITLSHLAVTLQSADHPWLMQVPESLYLKCLWCFVEKE